jgi:hypothetical protein
MVIVDNCQVFFRENGMAGRVGIAMVVGIG